jgi:hypothetical protein
MLKDTTKSLRRFYSEGPLIANCCVAKILHLLTNPSNLSVIAHLFGEICWFMYNRKKFKFQMGFNIPIPDHAIIYEDPTGKKTKMEEIKTKMKEFKAKDYFVCRIADKWVKGRGEAYISFAYTPLINLDSFDYLSHNHIEKKECKYCLEELNQGLEYKSLHPK